MSQSRRRLSRRSVAVLVLPVLLVGGAAAAAMPSAATFAVRINAGGSALIDASGHEWSADRLFSGGRTSTTSTPVASETAEVDRSERYGNLHYAVPVPAGRYVVRLHLTEIYWNQPGARLFDVDVEGRPALRAFDLAASVGPRRTELVDTTVDVTDGVVDVVLRTLRDNASITGLEVLGVGGGADAEAQGIKGQTSDGPASDRPTGASAASTVTGATVSAAPLRVNAGGGALVEADGSTWLSDGRFVTGGASYTTDQTIDSTTPSVDRTERYGQTRWTLPVPAAGRYRLRLHLTEIYWTRPGSRLFDVYAEGVKVVDDMDLLTRVSPRQTLVVEVPVTVTGGALDVRAVTLRDNASITGIEVLPSPRPDGSADALPTTTPTTAPTGALSIPQNVPIGSPSPVLTAHTAPDSTGDNALTEPKTAAPAVPASLPVEAFGAVGDGRHDDTAALQRGLDTVPAGLALRLSAGKTYVQSDVLHVRRTGTHLSGPGELRAVRQDRSSLWVEADDVTIDGGLRLTTPATTRRWDAWEQMRLRLLPFQRTVVRDVTVDGSAAAGIYVGGAQHFVLDGVTVRNTRADGIHMTGGAAYGTVLSPTVENSGDDGVAVVSYGSDAQPSHDIVVRSPQVRGTVWGRGVSVVGGTDITYRDIAVERSDAAAVYVAAEGAPWNSYPPVRVRVLGGRIDRANTDSGVDHGAVLVLAGSSRRVQDVEIAGLAITATRATAHRSVGVITYGSPPTGVVLRDLAITGGPREAYEGNTGSGYSLLGWTVDGRRMADVRR